MWPIVASALIGGLLVARTKPRVSMTRAVVLGPKTGHEWNADKVVGTSVVIISGRGGKVVFRREKGELHPISSSGNPQAVRLILGDFKHERQSSGGSD